MCRVRLSLSSLLSTLLFGLLLTTGIGPTQMSAAQQLSFNADRPIESLRQAATPTASDSQLVALATVLQKARADTEISYDEYKDGVWFFQRHHPGFYGNFFGDPFYATYDVRYQKLTWKRQLVEPEINPVNSFRNDDWFFCPPLSYDPAFNGLCRGFEFAVSDFFFLPAGPAFAQRVRAPERDHARTLATRRDPDAQTRSIDPAPRKPDTSRTPVAGAPRPDRPPSGRSTSNAVKTPATDADLSFTRGTQSQTPDRLAPEFKMPDDVRASMRETASSLEQKEAILRIRREIERRSERGQLSIRERARVAQRIAEENGMDELTRSISRIQGMRADRMNRRVPERLDRSEIKRQIRRERTDRSPDSRSSKSVQRRSADPASSESPRHRSRSSENPSDNRQSRDEEPSGS